MNPYSLYEYIQTWPLGPPILPSPDNSMVKPESKSSLRQKARAAARTAILRAAQEQFGAHGYQATKMTDIARSAGVAAGTLYNYFPSKEAVFDEIVREEGQATIARLRKQIAANQCPLESLRIALREIMRVLDEKRQYYAILVQIQGSPDDEPKASLSDSDCATNDLRSEVAEIFAELLAQAQREGKIQTLPIEDLVSAILGLLNGFLGAWIRQGHRPGFAKKADVLVEIFFKGVQCEGPTS